MNQILIAVDFSDVTGRVIEKGSEIAKAFGVGVTLMHTEPPDQGYIYYDAGYSPGGAVSFMNEIDPGLEESRQEKVKNDKHALDVLKKQVEAMGVEVDTFLIEGEVSAQIVSKAVSSDAGMVVIGNHRHGKLYKFLFDDIGTTLTNKATCPVLVVPTDKKK